ncbi:hypothetical protein DMH08_15850 [Actinomadura sp. WAC 06369]|nr:hypothetical protein DMH08_15850 [Actinomadura sp. WAC 06369]
MPSTLAGRAACTDRPAATDRSPGHRLVLEQPRLDLEARHRLDSLCDAGPQLAVRRERVREFAEEMVHRHVRRLDTQCQIPRMAS